MQLLRDVSRRPVPDDLRFDDRALAMCAFGVSTSAFSQLVIVERFEDGSVNRSHGSRVILYRAAARQEVGCNGVAAQLVRLVDVPEEMAPRRLP
jgi:hypothetical protein